MLGSLARKLRVFGFDTSYFRDGTDSELKRLARDEARILLTSDRRLFAEATASGLPAFLVQGQSDRARIESIVEQARSASITLEPGATRCAVCNEQLALVKKGDLAGQLPESVLRRHREFYACDGCGKLFWKGRQWSRLRRLYSVLRPYPSG
jgi:hypothetical protein